MTFPPVGRWLVAGLLVVAPLLVGCASASDVADGPSATVTGALAQVPANADSVTITDWEALRQDFPGLADQDDRASALMASVPSVSELSRYAPYMEDEFGWSVLDAIWELRWTGSPDSDVPVGPMTVKLPDSVDLDAFESRLEADGFASSDAGNGTLWSLDLSELNMQIPITTWWVDDEAHIVKASVGRDEAAMTVAGDPSDDLVDVADEVGDASVLLLSVGQLACVSVDPTTLLGENPNEIAGRLREQIEQYADLQRPRARAETWSGSAERGASQPTSSTASVVMLYESDQAAKSDHQRRLDLLDEGTSLVTARPYADLYSVTDDSVSGDVSRYTIGEGAENVFDAVYAHDWPFAVCPS